MSGPPRPHDGQEEPADDAQARTRPASLTGQVRKALLGGASALLGSEEGLRGALSEVKLPKDVVRLLLQQVERTRDEVTSLVGREVKRALRGADLRGELRRALVGLRVDVRASVRFREDGPESEDDATPAGTSVRLRRELRRRRRRAGPGAAAATSDCAAERGDVASAPREGGLGSQDSEADAPPATDGPRG